MRTLDLARRISLRSLLKAVSVVVEECPIGVGEKRMKEKVK